MGDTSSPAAVAGQAEATTQARRYAWQTYLSWKEKNGESWESVVLRVAKEIQIAVMARMVELEKEAKLKPAGKRAQPKITGIAGRYQKYLQAMKASEDQSE